MLYTYCVASAIDLAAKIKVTGVITTPGELS